MRIWGISGDQRLLQALLQRNRLIWHLASTQAGQLRQAMRGNWMYHTWGCLPTTTSAAAKSRRSLPCISRKAHQATHLLTLYHNSRCVCPAFLLGQTFSRTPPYGLELATNADDPGCRLLHIQRGMVMQTKHAALEMRDRASSRKA